MGVENQKTKDIRELVRTLVGDLWPLDKIKSEVAKRLRLELLNSILENYVEYKYIKYSLHHVEKIILSGSMYVGMPTKEIQEMASQVFTARCLDDLPDVIYDSDYFQLILEEDRLLTERDERVILRKIQVATATSMEAVVSTVIATKDALPGYMKMVKERFLHVVSVVKGLAEGKTENEMVKSWMNFATEYPEVASDYEEAFGQLETKMKNYLQDELAGGSSVEEALKEMTADLKSQLQRPATFTKETKHGKKILTFRKPFVLMSEIMGQLEKWLKDNPETEEAINIGGYKLREAINTENTVIAPELIYIDCDLKNATWHGKNICLVSEKIECIVPRVIWDVSGLAGKNASQDCSKHGTNYGEDGNDGECGLPGESGGYGAFFADTFLNMKRMTFKTNGGLGGNGQNGGNGYKGEDGRNGKSMSVSELSENFPSPGRFAGSYMMDALKKSVRKVNELVVKWDKGGCSRQGINWDTGEREYVLGNKYCHLQGYTKDNLHIEFGFYASDKLVYQKRQIYVLVKGEQGTQGKQGGFGGSGGVAGKGGYSGSLSLQYLNGATVPSTVRCNLESEIGRDGNNGSDGVDGARGRSGSNGKDVGYMDSQWWGDKVVRGPGTLTAENYSDSVDTCCWCMHHGAWRAIETTSRGRPVLQDASERQKVTKTKAKAASIKKNAIDSQKMLDHYVNEVKQNKVKLMHGDTLDFEKVLGEVLQKSHDMLESLAQEGELHASESISVVKDSPSEVKEVDRFRKKREISKLFQANNTHAPVKTKKNDKEYEMSDCRIKTLEKIREEMAPRWSHHSAKCHTLVRRPTSTKGGSSALHALFGEKNAFGFFETRRKRKEICEKLKSLVPFSNDPEALSHLKSSLTAFFEDEFTQDNRNSSKSDKKNPTATLDKYREKFQANIDGFSWNLLLQDTNALNEYIDFLAQPSIPFLKSDLLLIAHVYGIKVKLYRCHAGIEESFPMDNNDPAFADTHIAINSNYEFCKLEEVTKRDMTEVTKKIGRILQDVLALEKSKDISKYLNKKVYLKPPKEEKEKKVKVEDQKGNVESDASFQKKLALIEKITKAFCSSENTNNVDGRRLERLVLETALHLWPLMYLQLFYDRMVTEELNRSSLHTAFSKVTEAISVGSEGMMTPLIWIVAAYPASEWELEISLLTLEEYFEAVANDSVLIWRDCLVKFPPKLIECIRQLIEHGTAFKSEDTTDFTNWLWGLTQFQLSPSMDFSKLSGVGKSQWPFQLRRLYLEVRLKELPNVSWNNDTNKQSQAMYYLNALFNEKRDTVLRLLDAFQNLLAKDQRPAVQVTKALANFYGGLWELDRNVISSLQSAQTFSSWMKLMEQRHAHELETRGLRSLQEIQSLIDNDSNSTMSKDDVAKAVWYVETLKSPEWKSKMSSWLEELQENFDNAMATWLAAFEEKLQNENGTRAENMSLQLEAVAMVDCVIRNTPELGYALRDTQKVAILSALNLSSNGRNLLSQIATGEGKTCIVLAVAIVRGLFSEKTDVVTSSAVLAQRDATAYKDIYEAFGLTVGEVTSESISERRRAYLCTVCYGEVSHFQRDYLLDRFYSQNIRGNRGHQNLIVDEVDSMFLDKGNSVLYLSHQPPDLSSLEALFVAIWVNVVQSVNAGVRNSLRVRDVILGKIFSSIDTDDLKVITTNVQETNDILKWLVSSEIISSNGRINITVDDISNINHAPDPLRKFEQRVKYLLKKNLEAPGRIPVMNYLKPFVEHHLMTWINSAFRACTLVEGREYVVDVGHSKASLDKDPRIMILDLDTGVDLKDSQWNEGLHQFLQLKHGCQLSLLNLKAVFISNISYFKEYPRIFGLTGTIGTESDREFLRTTYNVELLCMPLAQPKQFIEEEPVICFNMEEWKDKVTTEAKAKIEGNRSLLVVCGTVQDAEVLYSHVKQKLRNFVDENAVELYRRDYEEFKATAVEDGLPPKQILIATNLAGRGTDIKLSPELTSAGGLHIIVSYLPDNLRVEQQAFGRASRSGDPGSGRLVFIDNISGGSEMTTGSKDAIDLKILRDEMEMHRVSDIQTYYTKVILKEEEVFKSFRNSFEDVISTLMTVHKDIAEYAMDAWRGAVGKVKNLFVSKSAKEQKEEKERNMEKLLEGDFKDVKELIMYSMLDEWAYWLDRYSCHLMEEYRQSELGAKGVLTTTEFVKGGYEEADKLMQDFMEMTWAYENRMSRYKQPGFITDLTAKLVLNPIIGTALGDYEFQAMFEAYPLELIKEPAMITKVAKSMLVRKMPKTAHKFLSKVISQDKDNVVALYYQLVCKLNLKEGKSSDFPKLVDEVEKKLEECRMRQLGYASTIEQFKSVGNQAMFVGDGYRKQKEIVVKLLDMHKASLDAMVGTRGLSPQDFSSICNEHVAEHLMTYLMKEQKAVKEACFVWKDDRAKALEELAEVFCLEIGQLENILKEFNGKLLIPQVENELRSKLDLPSRADFWREISECLEDIQLFAVVLPEATDVSADDKSPKQNDFLEWAKMSNGRPFIIKYGCDLGSDSKMQLILKGNSKEEFLKQQKFKWLRKCGRLCFEQCAFVNEEKFRNLKIKKYFQIDKKSFTMIDGVTQGQSEKIFEILESSGIINANGELQNIEEWTLKKPSFGDEFEIYREDISRILQSKCRYKFEFFQLLEHIKKTTNDKQEKDKLEELKVSLLPRPWKDFILSAMELGFITGRQANSSYFPEETAGSFVKDVIKNSSPAKWISWIGKKLGVAGEYKALLSYHNLSQAFPDEDSSFLVELWKELQKKQWIKPVLPGVAQIIEKMLRKGMDLSFESLIAMFPGISQVMLKEIKGALEASGATGKKQEILIFEIDEKGVTENKLHEKFQYHQPELLGLLQWRQEFGKEHFLKTVFEKVYESQGKLHTLDNPDATLVDIEFQFGNGLAAQQERLQCQQEICTFVLNAFEHTIDTIERTYTFKMIASATFIAAFGLAQIALGIWLQTFVGVGTFVGSGFIGEGFGDLVYAWHSFRSGYFSWKDYATHKLSSVVTTALTIGIGAAIARGVKYSKFGEKLFGSWGKWFTRGDINKTLAETGVANIPQRSLFEEGLKSFGYKVVQAAAWIGGTAAVSLIYEKALKTFVEHFSSQFFNDAHQAIQQHPISNEISSLCDKVGVKKAQRIIGQCQSRVVNSPGGIHGIEDDAHSYLSQMLAPVMGGVTEAIGKMASAEQSIGQGLQLTGQILQLVNVIMKAKAYYTAVTKMRESVDKYLGEIQGELLKEMSIITGDRKRAKEFESEFGISEDEEEEESVLEKKRAKNDLIFNFKEETHHLMREKIGSVMRYTIIEPLMNAACQKLLRSVGRLIRGKICERREARIRSEVDKVIDKLGKSAEGDISPEVKKELRLELVRLCSLSRDPKTIAHVVENGGPLGVEAVQAFANKYNVVIEVESDNPDVPKVYQPENNVAPTATIKLKHRTLMANESDDIGHWSSANNQTEGGETSSSPDCLLEALRAELSAAGINVNDVNRESLANFMRIDANFQTFIENGWHHTYNALGGFGGARKPYTPVWKKTRVNDENARAEIYRVQERCLSEGRMNFRSEVPPEVVTGDTQNENPENSMGCITMFATETVQKEGSEETKKVPVFVSAKVTKETRRPYSERNDNLGEQLKQYVLDDASPKERYQMGHIMAWVLGGPSLWFNFYAQDAKVNNGVDKSLVIEITKFIDQNGWDANPEVEINTSIRRDPGNVTPLCHTSHVIFRLNGRIVREECVRVFNDRNHKYTLSDSELQNPQRRNMARRAPGG